MSVGGLIGGAVGGAVGFLIGGPVGAAIGAGIGAGIGMMVDPVQPDMPAPGDPGAAAVNLAKEGTPVQDVLGTVKVNGNIIWSCCSRSVEVKEEQGGKGGGSQEVTTGYEYYLTWAIGICRGPVDRLYTVYANDKVVWSGELERPASGGMVTISLEGMGACDFYFGTEDQEPNSYMGARLRDSSLNPAYRGICYAVLKDCALGSYNRAPSLYFVVQKSPSIEALESGYKDIETYDYNPAHAVYYVLNRMADIDVQYLDADDFNEAARILQGEARGVSIGFSQSSDVLTYVESILKHISGGIRWGGDSKLHLFLYRESQDTDSLPSFGPEDFLEKPRIDRKSWLDTINEFKVQYSRRILREPGCPTGCDNFAISSQAEIGNNETRQFTVQNDDWTEENCSDLSFLSDGLPEGRKGEFWGLVYQGGGKWQGNYTTNKDLCTGQDPNDPDCPIICGIRIPCCTCETVDDLAWDSVSNPETMAPGDSETIYVTGGRGPFIWTIKQGSGFGFDAAGTLKSIQTAQEARSVQLYTNGAACGSCEIEVLDFCGQTATGYIRCTTGVWKLKGRYCGLKGSVSCYGNYGGDITYYEYIFGNKKQVQATKLPDEQKIHPPNHCQWCQNMADAYPCGDARWPNTCNESNCIDGDHPDLPGLFECKSTDDWSCHWQDTCYTDLGGDRCYECDNGDIHWQADMRMACVYHDGSDPGLWYYEWECS